MSSKSFRRIKTTLFGTSAYLLRTGYTDSLSLAHTLIHVTTNVCDTTHIPSTYLYACIYRLRSIAFICIYCTSWGQVHIQQSATNISYTDISLCTGIHKNGPIFPHKGIKIYAADSHITTKRWEGKASDKFHLPARSLVHAHAQERNCRGGSCVWGHQHTGREGDVQKHWHSICKCTSKKKTFKKKSVPYWKLCFSKQILKSPGSPSLKVILYEWITNRFLFSPA